MILSLLLLNNRDESFDAKMLKRLVLIVFFITNMDK